MQLEIINRYTRTPGRRPPLLFVHGACCGAWVWDEHFLPYFASKGYDAHAVSLRGHGASGKAGPTHLVRLTDYVEDLDQAVLRLQRPPVLIGHSLGGVVVQRWLKHNKAPGVVLMGSGPPHGMLPSTMTMLARNPSLVMQVVAAQTLGPWAMSMRSLQKVLFSNSLSVRMVQEHSVRDWSAESLRVGLELLLPVFPRPVRPAENPGMPVLVLGAEHDFFVSPTMVEATARVFGTKAQIIPGMAHAMMLEPRWKDAADRILLWLGKTLGSSSTS